MDIRTKLSYWLIVGSIVAGLVHNLIFAILKIEEGVLLTITFILFLAFFVSIFRNIYTYIRKKGPNDLWKLAWLGLLGLIGVIPEFGPVFYVCFAFFAFFGFRNEKNR